MATVYKVLGQSAPSATTDTTLYTVPAATSAVCSTLSIANRSAVTVTYRIAVRPAGDALANTHYIAYDASVEANDSILLTIGMTLAETDVVTVRATTEDLTFMLFGSEIS